MSNETTLRWLLDNYPKIHAKYQAYLLEKKRKKARIYQQNYEKKLRSNTTPRS